MSTDSARIREIIQEVTKGCSDAVDGECHWRRDYLSLKEEFSLYRERIHGETQNELEEMEARLLAVKSEADQFKESLESDNHRLRQQKSMIELKIKSLQEELAETKTVMDNQLRHANNLKKDLDLKCSELEDVISNKETIISTLRVQVDEDNKRIGFLGQEIKTQDSEITQLRELGAQMKHQHDSDMKTLVQKMKSKEREIHRNYVQSLECANVNFKKLHEEFIQRRKTLAVFIENERLRDAGLRTCRSNIQEFIDNTLKQTHEAMEKIEDIGLMATMTKKLVEVDIHKVAEALKHLKTELKSFQRESEGVCVKIYKILGAEADSFRTVPEVTQALYTKPSYESFKNIANGLGEAISEEGCEILELIEKERANIKTFLSAIMKWNMKIQGQRGQFHEQILHLEDAQRLEKMQYIRDIDFTNQKLAVYKKLIFKLRKKLDSEMNHKCPVNVKSEEGQKSTKDDKLRPVTETIQYIPALPKQSHAQKGTETSQKPVPSDISCCAEFKYMLERSEGVLKQIEESELAAVSIN